MGRPKGTANKTTRALKEMILQALTNAGGVAYLTTQAKAEPRAFMALLGRVLPATLADNGDGGGLTVNIITFGEDGQQIRQPIDITPPAVRVREIG